jgi:predicted nucleic acid-binding protein
MKWVVDASVAAKWLAPEPGSEAAEDLLDAELLLAPDLIYVEVANILWKKRMRGEIEAVVATAALHWLLKVPLEVHDAAGLLLDAALLSERLRHPAYDCFYLALAARNEVPLVTADRRLVELCRGNESLAFGRHVRWLGASA